MKTSTPAFLAALFLALMLAVATGCGDSAGGTVHLGGHDTGGVSDTGDVSDAGGTVDAGDTSDVTDTADAGADTAVDTAPPPKAIGEACTDDSECATNRCESFGDKMICTDDCTDSCPGQGTSCFNGTCVPADYCDDPDGNGYGQGPGCQGTECDLCDVNASCNQDTAGQWSCTCDPGFSGDGTSCTDVDECSDPSLNNCDANATCTNTDGSFTCACNSGFSGDGTSCNDVDECADPSLNNCDANATCTNTDGSFTCACNSGFSGDGTSCTDVDECSDPSRNNCDANATCTNTDGSFACACNSGFSGDGTSCTDVDECSDPSLNNCDANATCTNTDGSFTCACNSGFSGDGTSCTDVDECSDPSLNNCDTNATCTNTPGSFTCACNSGYVGDGTSCRMPASCLEVLNNGMSHGSGTYTIAPNGSTSFDVYCDMTTQGGGWTLLGTEVNSDGVRDWNSLAVMTDASTFGTLATRYSVDYKSPAWTTVAGDDLMFENPEYTFGFLGLLGNQTYDAHITANWPTSCNTTWMRSGADFGTNLTPTQMQMLGYTYRGFDNNADCFPGHNENTAISLLATDAWVDGLTNTPGGQSTWITEDHSMVKLSNLTPQSCTAGNWPCNDNGLMQDAASQCYDASCKVRWVAIFVR